MTRKQIDMMSGQKIGIEAALRKAFEAGEAFIIGGHKVFRGVHEGADIVVPALMSRIYASLSTSSQKGGGDE